MNIILLWYRYDVRNKKMIQTFEYNLFISIEYRIFVKKLFELYICIYGEKLFPEIFEYIATCINCKY